ncbi:uncharacterized protein YPO0396 [Novosphingobium sp. PhB165]|uniref:SbcC/MukB-like Walker B domain-containing protein n=1 Tax=Novosphingobium sp. PhB165 TaxID=2485105 RepID=UPI001048AEE4|nr:SbcC/MukB-like Walker B domain-containing protein [Novosphingobium sp. PhB165]TCM16078.1 uncharacterized protein YPO0396 [Novosphingobium sp. PhB165]
MIKLSRINLINWYTFESLTIDVRGSTSLIGPNGAGKSSILDAIQVVLTGNNRNYFQLNASANVTAGQTRKVGEHRSVFDYCLGRVAGETLRSNCISYVSLVFERERDGKCWTIGVGMSAVEGQQSEEVLGAFIAPDQALRDTDFLQDIDGKPYVVPYDELITRLRRVPGFDNLGHRPTHFTRRVLMALGGKGHHADAEKFLKTLKNGLRIREMKSATEFVREFLLDPAGLNIEELRKSVATWRGLLKKIDELEKQKQQVTEAVTAYRELLDRMSEEVRMRWVAGKAERDRLAERVKAVTDQLARKQEEWELAERRVKQTREALTRTQDEIKEITRALDNDSREQAIRGFREINLPNAERAHTDAEQAYQAYFASVAAAASLADKLVLVYAQDEYQQARDALAALRARVGGETSLAARDVDQIVHRTLKPLERYAVAAQGARDNHVTNLVALRSQIRENREQLQRLSGGKALIADPTLRLIQYLAAHDIEATPIAELVEVTDELWTDAAETLLGAAGEALVVEPDQAQRAITLLRQQRRDYPGTQIVNTTKTGEIGQAPTAGSLADIIATESVHARAFINRRLNAVRRVDSEHDLLRFDRAVTPDCLVASGGSIENRRPARVHRLGKDANRKNIPLLENLLESQERAYARHEADAAALKGLIEGIQKFLEVGGSRNLEELERIRHNAAEAVAQIRDNIRTLEGERPVEIQERLEGLKSDLEDLRQQLEADAAAERVAGPMVGIVKEKLSGAEAGLEKAQGVFADRDILPSDERDAAMADFEHLMREQGGLLENVQIAAQDNAARARSRVSHLAVQAPQKAYAYAFEAGIADQFQREALPAIQLEWLEKQLAAIVNNALSDYREQAQEARTSIETSLKTDMLVKLHDRIEGAKRQIRSLNRSLQMRPFHGELYRFDVKPDRFFAEIVEIARRVQLNSIDVSTLFDDANSGIEPSLMKGVERIKRMIDEGDNVEQISDYRNYLHFDLQTTTLDGERVTSDYAKRQGSGSGGEKQVPFYIAMACAMSNVCHSSEDNRDRLGLGIILFDEAFNALDGGNVNSCLALLREFNLQVIACAPIEKLGVFMEQMDTVLSVRRIGTTTMLYADYLKDAGREAFREANPGNEPFDLFKERYSQEAQAADAAQ